jgi:hypothetical protein
VQRLVPGQCEFQEVSVEGWRGWCYVGDGTHQVIGTKDAKIARQIADHWERTANQLEKRQSFERLHVPNKNIILPS